MVFVLLLISLICFVVKVFGGHIADLDLDALGHVFLVAAFLVGAAPPINFTRK
jgi:hypothetical protein